MILYDTATKDWLLYEVIERKVFDNREALTYTQNMHKNLHLNLLIWKKTDTLKTSSLHPNLSNKLS